LLFAGYVDASFGLTIFPKLQLDLIYLGAINSKGTHIREMREVYPRRPFTRKRHPWYWYFSSAFIYLSVCLKYFRTSTPFDVISFLIVSAASYYFL